MGKYSDIYKTLKENIEKTKGKAFSEKEFEHYMDNVEKNQNRNVKMSSNDSKVHKAILNQLMTNTKANEKLKDKLPNVEAEKKAHIEKLKKESQMYAKANMKKSEANAIKAKQKAARKELERIRKETIKNQALAEGREATKEELADAELYKFNPTNARDKYGLTEMVNEESLGTEDERKDLNGKPSYEELAKKGKCKQIVQENAERGIRLKGAMFEPDPSVKKVPPKVALVFSGSHGAGAKYIDSIKDAYLEQGITVVQFDYRGFGNSSHIANGEEVKGPLSESTMYEDGMEMYKFVSEKMKIPPENTIIHGFSLGGAVASRVALEVSKKIENERKINGEKKEVTKGLGGVVLHSPMKSMYYAAKTLTDTFRGFGAWAFGGNYNTEEHMIELSKVDKNVPVHVIGGKTVGNEKEVDWLAPDKTGLEQSLKGKFTSYTTFHGNGNHEGLDIDGDSVPNASRFDTKLGNFLENGRKASLEKLKEIELKNKTGIETYQI